MAMTQSVGRLGEYYKHCKLELRKAKVRKLLFIFLTPKPPVAVFNCSLLLQNTRPKK